MSRLLCPYCGSNLFSSRCLNVHVAELNCLGHIVSKDGIKVYSKKIQSVADWPEPSNLNEVQQLASLTSFANTFRATPT